MNQTLELWKQIPDASGDISTGNFFYNYVSLIINLVHGDRTSILNWSLFILIHPSRNVENWILRSELVPLI